MRSPRERSKADLSSVGWFTELDGQEEGICSRVQFIAEELKILSESFTDWHVIIFGIEGQEALNLVDNLERREYWCSSNLVWAHHADIQGLEEDVKSTLYSNHKLLVLWREAVVVGGGEFRKQQAKWLRVGNQPIARHSYCVHYLHYLII